MHLPYLMVLGILVASYLLSPTYYSLDISVKHMIDEAATSALSSLRNVRVDVWDIKDDKFVAVRAEGVTEMTPGPEEWIALYLPHPVGNLLKKQKAWLLCKAVAGAPSNVLQKLIQRGI